MSKRFAVKFLLTLISSRGPKSPLARAKAWNKTKVLIMNFKKCIGYFSEISRTTDCMSLKHFVDVSDVIWIKNDGKQPIKLSVHLLQHFYKGVS